MNTQGRFSRWIRKILIAVGAIVVAAAMLGVGLRLWLNDTYVHAVDSRGSEDVCVKVPGVAHPEDIKVDWLRQRAFVAALSERKGLVRGIYRIDLANSMSLTNVSPKGMSVELHPLGLSLYTAPDGRQTLFVINRAAPTGHSVLIFDVAEDGTLKFNTEVKGAALYNPNDLTAVGPRQFYLTNDHRGADDALDTWLGQLRFLLGLDTSGDLVFYDGEKFRPVVKGLRLANGLNKSPDGARVYLAESFGQSVTTFDRNPQTNDLRFVSKTMLPGVPDNIDVTPDGKLFVAVFPNMLETLKYLASNGHAKRPFSEILELVPAGDTFEVKPAWIDDGQRITVVTVGTPYAKTGNKYRLLLGTISPEDDYILACAPGATAASIP